MLYTLNVYSAVYQLYSVKLEEKNNKINLSVRTLMFTGHVKGKHI